jgi:hypothetical protein
MTFVNLQCERHALEGISTFALFISTHQWYKHGSRANVFGGTKVSLQFAAEVLYSIDQRFSAFSRPATTSILSRRLADRKVIH